jgi:hypothetical protein
MVTIGFSFIWVDRNIGVDQLVHKLLERGSNLMELFRAPHPNNTNTPRFSVKVIPLNLPVGFIETSRASTR